MTDLVSDVQKAVESVIGRYVLDEHRIQVLQYKKNKQKYTFTMYIQSNLTHWNILISLFPKVFLFISILKCIFAAFYFHYSLTIVKLAKLKC